MTDEILWRFLVMDDRQADEIGDFISEHNVLEAPDRVIVEKCTKFKDALENLNEKRIDLVILDLRDDSIALEDEDKPLPGEEVFDQIRKSRFVPVVFYTAHPVKVDSFKNPYTRVVARGNPRALRKAIKEVFETRLPRLIRFLENEQRDYMWDHIQTHWQETSPPHDKTDLSYLLARRLANTLERKSIRRFLAYHSAEGPQEEDDRIHPIEMYIYPPINQKLSAGDILKGPFGKENRYWIVLTPSCDLEHEKVTQVIFAECVPLIEQPELIKVQECIEGGKAISNGARDNLKDLICNNRKGKNIQPERYYFLPGTFFIPDLVVDYQSLVQIPVNEIKPEFRTVSLDSPFAEACLARFARYYGRLGTPDVDKDFVYTRAVESIRQQSQR